MCPSWSPPETKDSAIDSPDAQRQEWFAQYFSFWSTTDLQTQRFSMSTELFKKKKKKKPMKKNKQKTGKNLQTICYLSSLIGSGINPLWNQSTETVNPGLRIASPRRVDQTHRTWCRWFPLLGETPRFSTSCRWPRPKWIEPDRDIKCHRSDLIWLFDSLWLFHCGGVSLVVQWQWSSVCLMFISFLYSSTYFAVSWN